MSWRRNELVENAKYGYFDFSIPTSYDAPQPTGDAMKKRSASGKAVKGRAAPKLRRRSQPKTVVRSKSSPIAEETEVARLTRENARLLSELRENQHQKTAIGEVLTIISHSTFDLEKVLNLVLELAARLSEADKGVILRASENRSYHAAASYQHTPEFMESHKGMLFASGRSGVVGRVLLDGKSVQIPDIFNDPEFAYRKLARRGGFRTILGVPLLREGTPIGILVLHRADVRPFTEKQIKLVETFAAQAVIAIENARLLNELRQRTADLTASLEQQTATSDVLQVISSFPGDLQPVFDAMLEKAARICDATFGRIYRWDGDALHLVGTHNTPPAFAEAARRRSPIRPDPRRPVGRMLATKTTVHIADLAAEPMYAEERDPSFVAAVELGGIRTLLDVPMLKENELIGAIAIYRQVVQPFTDKQIELVQNFAAQAVIAIENARLLNELRQRTEEVEKLNQHLEQRVADQVGEIERMGRLRRFLPPQVADLIVASGTEKQLESHRREITALFCDLRGFTGFSEASAPEDVMTLLRDYHAAIGEIIIKYSGTLERYAGDGVMVVFNDPVPVDNPALRAVQMALETREAMGALTEKWRELGHDVGFGIGIAHGYATLGTIGFEGRFDYAAIGTVSNVASRLCDEAKPGQILISPRVFMAVKDAVTVEPVGEFTLKGIGRPLAAYNVLAALPPSP
jgi:adenylate cyclase